MRRRHHRRQLPRTVGHPVIGKTGTSDENWTAQPRHLHQAAGDRGHGGQPDKAQQPHTYNASAIKANNAAVFTLRDAMAGKPAVEFTPPPTNLVYGTKVPIPDVDCKSVARGHSRAEGGRLRRCGGSEEDRLAVPRRRRGQDRSGRKYEQGQLDLAPAQWRARSTTGALDLAPRTEGALPYGFCQ